MCLFTKLWSPPHNIRFSFSFFLFFCHRIAVSEPQATILEAVLCKRTRCFMEEKVKDDHLSGRQPLPYLDHAPIIHGIHPCCLCENVNVAYHHIMWPQISVLWDSQLQLEISNFCLQRASQLYKKMSGSKHSAC